MSAPLFEPFSSVRSRTVVLPQDDIDTDQIFPARFMTTTSRDDLADACFHDWRHDAEGRLIAEYVLNRINPAEHCILVAGSNFGSGSSREHAAWALVAFGFRVIISSAIGDIFAENAIRNGLLPVTVSVTTAKALIAVPGHEVTVNLVGQRVAAKGIDEAFAIHPFARRCLLQGNDALNWLVQHQSEIALYETQRGFRSERG